MTCMKSRLITPSLSRIWMDTSCTVKHAQPKRFFGLVLVTFLLAILAQPSPSAAQGVIFVTSLADKVNGIGGCSLEEAIYAATLLKSEAIISYAADGTPNTVPTQCVAGTGIDRIILPSESVFVMNQVVLDASNPFGATATPMISTQITIEANGSTLQWTGSKNARAFSVASTGKLTLLDIYIRDFHVKGGDGGSGGGGGLGAGGAIFVKGEGTLNIERSTFSGNKARGGNGAGPAFGGGGGGLGGNGGSGPTDVFSFAFGAGGGGAIGDGAGHTSVVIGNGGGGTISDDGFMCGGPGGGTEGDGDPAPCAGGGGGGGTGRGIDFLAGTGGNGAYGGGGGGGGQSGAGDRGRGGNGGFGGGGGSGWEDEGGACGSGSSGGDGGFGGGGGAGPGGQLFGGPGMGGSYGGNASCINGGGGGALGGAIFSDGGIVTIENSTFSGNSVTHGKGAGANSTLPALDGGDAGGAIFATGGGLKVHHSTISGNQSTVQGGGIVVSSIVIFELQNTIVAGNGPATASQCFVFGNATVLTGSGNAISSNNSNCPGIVTTDDPQVGPLQLNSPGITPTMAISKFSSAFDTADASSSLKIDQRGFPRPQENGFDIGAFELCIPFSVLAINCVIPPDINPNPPTMVNMTIRVSPAGVGTTIPVPADYAEALNSVVAVTATPNPGYGFLNWTGGAVEPANPSTAVIIDQGKTITANFAPLSATMAGNIIAKMGAMNARVWMLSLLDNGPGVTQAVLIHDFTLTQTFGAACKPVVKNAALFPLSLGNLGPSQTGTTTLTLDFTGCAASTRFTAKFTYSANNGAVSGFVTRSNQYQ
jgi:hypothetical protein